MTEITVTVSGPVGCGKSAIAGEIEIALKALGVPVRFAHETKMHSEKNMTGADWIGYLEMYKPSVAIVEETDQAPDGQQMCQSCGYDQQAHDYVQHELGACPVFTPPPQPRTEE